MTRHSRSRSPEPGERLQKLIASAGVASRRAAEQMIVDGRVRVNGRVVRELGTRADPKRDRIQVDGRRLRLDARRRYFVVHKPRGVVSTTRDPEGRRTVCDLVRAGERLYPVGRLDVGSEGLVLLTNDGELAQVLLHPSFEVPRTYRVTVDGSIDARAMRAIAEGVELDGERTAPCKVRLLEQAPERSAIEVELVQGRKRQIRRVLESVGHPVRRLVRVRYGPLRLRGLRVGEARPLTDDESAALERMVAQSQESPPSRTR